MKTTKAPVHVRAGSSGEGIVSGLATTYGTEYRIAPGISERNRARRV